MRVLFFVVGQDKVINHEMKVLFFVVLHETPPLF